MTAVSPLRWPLWWAWLRALFWFAPRYAPFLVEPLRKLAFIHVGQWSVVRHLPSRDRPGRRERLRPGFLVFQTNYDGAWRPYIEAFARVMWHDWLGIWSGTRHFPGPLPASNLLAHIEEIDKRPAYYYSAHEQESLRSIVAALEVDAALDALIAQDLPPELFAVAFGELVTRLQCRL